MALYEGPGTRMRRYAEMGAFAFDKLLPTQLLWGAGIVGAASLIGSGMGWAVMQTEGFKNIFIGSALVEALVLGIAGVKKMRESQANARAMDAFNFDDPRPRP